MKSFNKINDPTNGNISKEKKKTSLKAVYSWLTSGQINFKVFGPLQPAFHSIISAVPVIGKNKDEDEVFDWVRFSFFY